MKKVKGGKELAVVDAEKKELVEAVKITASDITKYLCPTATEKEVYMALNIIKSFQLNPFKREVFIIKYGTSPAQVVVGYETYLKRAERTGRLNGFKVELSENGQKAICIIYRKDWKEPFIWETDRAEFDKNQSTWKTMGNFMLKKVCMAQAFRIAFPDEMGGLPYLKEEVDTFMPPNGVTKTKSATVSIPEDEKSAETKKEVKPTNPASEVLFNTTLVKKTETEKEKIADLISAIKKEAKRNKINIGQFDKILHDCGLGNNFDCENFDTINELSVLENIYENCVKFAIKRKK